jgi:hypothetical protein
MLTKPQRAATPNATLGQNGRAMQPLTHHEIMALVGPFSAQGRHVDLAASDRAARTLVFKPVEHVGPDGQPLTETLRLEPFGEDQHRLTRELRHPAGLQASVRAVGRQLGELLAGIEAVPPASQFCFGPGWALALSERLASAPGGAYAQRVMLQGVAQVGVLTLTMTVPSVTGVPAELTMVAPRAQALPLPQDLLAVLGWDWARLLTERQGWRSRLKLARREPERSADALAKLQSTAAHLAQTLAEPPARFHERHRGARWGVVLRRGIPVLTLVVLALGLWVLSRYAVGQETGAWVLLIHVPTVMLVISFRLQELAQFEIPPLPRRLKAAAWGLPDGLTPAQGTV